MNKQLLVGVFLATLVVTINAGKEEDDCVEELLLTKDNVNKINKLRPLPEDDPDFNKYLNCLYTKKGIIREDGFDWHKFSNSFFEDVIEMHRPYPNVRRDMLKKAVDQVVNACKDKNLHGSTQGQTVAKIKNCIQEELNKVYAEYHHHKN